MNATLFKSKLLFINDLLLNATPQGNIDIKNCLTNIGTQGYYLILSKFQSVTPQRHRGFFVPKVYTGSQLVKRLSAIQFNILAQDKTILKNLTLIGLYNFHVWETSPNKRKRISGAVSLETESEPIHDPFTRIMLLTQNFKGDNHV